MNHMTNARRSGNPARRAAAERLRDAGKTNITWVDWLRGARPRTLPLAIAPVLVGAGIAQLAHGFSWLLSALALAVALLIQIGVNFANDYSDGVRGTDAHRVGPTRLTASGLVAPRTVRAVALIFFSLAAVCGVAAAAIGERWWLLLVGAAAIVAAWCYTGGKRPYGYAGFGEVAVFVFFGLAATVGTVWLHTEHIPQEAWIAGSGVGLLAVAVLLANNIRDIATDRMAGKRTLSVRIGDRASRVFFAACVLVPFALPAVYLTVYPGMLLVFLAMIAALPAAIIVLWARSSRELVLALAVTGLAALSYGALLGAAFAF